MGNNKKINQQTAEDLKKSVEELEKKIKEQKELMNLIYFGMVMTIIYHLMIVK